MTRFRIAFTVEAETMFSIMSKMLPIDDLHVHEMQPEQSKSEPRAMPKPAVMLRVKRERIKTGPDLQSGTNLIIMKLFEDGQPHRAHELMPLFKAGGFSPNSVGSRLQTLRQRGILLQLGDGTWKLSPKVMLDKMKDAVA